LIAIHPDVLDRSARQIADSPGLETGGKFVGYAVTLPVDGNSRRETAERLGFEMPPARGRDAQIALVVLGTISPGPRSRRTAVELLPDGEFQGGVFDELQKRDPEVEHLGTWHSHHPNGLASFSGGDRGHYSEVIVDPRYGLDFFLAMLATDARGLTAPSVVEVYRRDRPSRPWIVDPRQVVVLGHGVRSLQRMVDQTEHAWVSGRNAMVASGGINTQNTRALDQRLRRQFARVGRPLNDGESVSWVLSDRIGSSQLDAVVTYPGGPTSSCGVSISVTGPDGSITIDLSSDIKRDLFADLSGVIERLQRAILDR
jgi:hypothetical protein